MDPNLKTGDRTQDGLKRSAAQQPTTSATTRASRDIADDTIGGSTAGGRAGTGGVSTNDVGPSQTTKSPLKER